jgi:glycosyltransferase involved in cell wall biosynthesis
LSIHPHIAQPMNQLRVAFLLTVAPVYWHPLLSQMARHVSQLCLFTAGWPNYAQGFENAFDVQIVGSRKVLSVNHKQKRYGSGFMYLSPLILKSLGQFKPHVIFADGFCLWTALVLLSKMWQRWQVIIVYDGSSPNVDFRNNKLRLTLRRIMTRYADGWVTNTNSGRSYLVEALGTPIQKVSKHPYLVPDCNAMLEGELPEFPPITPEQPIFLVVGQLIPRKGIEELIEGCALLLQESYSNFTVWIIGEGWQRNELKALGIAKGLESHLFWIGNVNYQKLGYFLKQADIFIFPSLEDVWGMAVPEAMSFGKPILCSKWAGSAELIVEGHNGYRFDPNQPQQIAKLMQGCIDSPRKFAQMGLKSKRIMENHKVEQAAQHLAELALYTKNLNSANLKTN